MKHSKRPADRHPAGNVTSLADNAAHQAEMAFSEAEIAAVYKTVFNRRDVRGQFRSDPIPDEVLSRLLYAAHHAPSVGYMQPWNFLLVRSEEIKRQVHAAFVEANEEAREMFSGERRELYSALKLEGILESPLNICITCDRQRSGPVVLGRTHMKMMDLYSSVCAAQNLWLAARAEGIGVGWVSIVKQQALQRALGIPEQVVPIAYLCLGYVHQFFSQPELESRGWRRRLPLEELVYLDQWGESSTGDEALSKQLQADRDFPVSFT